MTIILNGSTGITTPADTVTGNETVGGTLAVNGVSNALGTPGTSGNVMTSNGTAWVSSAPAGSTVPSATAIGQVPFSTDGSTWSSTQKIVQGTAVASTSGTSIDFTGIPSWVKRVTVMMNGISSNGTSNFQIQIGSGSVVSTGYLSQSWVSSGGGVITSGFIITSNNAAAYVWSGNAVLTLISSNTWMCTGAVAYVTGTSAGCLFAGNSSSLSGALDRVRVTTVNGTDTFDAGSINIMYE